VPDDIEPVPDNLEPGRDGIAPAGGGTSPGPRASDADRDRAVAQLQDALAAGMIDLDEFHDRSRQALAARTLGELVPVTADLPASGAQAVAAPDSAIELRHTLGSLKRSGDWAVPGRLRLRQRMGSAELDFTEATISHPVVSIELDVTGGSVEIRLPEGASASTDGVEAVLGSVQDHRKNAAPSGRPHFVFTGAMRWGSLELRGPRTHPFRRR
jgi:Domain of unknown function (DUF1707)